MLQQDAHICFLMLTHTSLASMFSNANHTRIKNSSFAINTTNFIPGPGA